VTGRYTQWQLDTGSELYQGGGIYWRKYNGALVPASVTPIFIELTQSECSRLLRQSKALFLRYSSATDRNETPWWYVVCHHYDKASLSGNTRSKINRGHKRCEVRRLEFSWFFENGYSCYRSAYQRYANAQPMREEEFKTSIREEKEGPFEWWGVFVGGELVGYCECIVEEKEVATNIIKLNPSFFKQYTSYALFDEILAHYTQKGMVISNGSRSISHDTNMQEFLLKLGFEKLFCNLSVSYQPLLGVFIRATYSSRSLLEKLPNYTLFERLKALLLQEKIVRSCCG